jgi:mannose-6-phosphate isomerase-like protein (cupin superfamily)/SAM-dependent methyltransferase
MVRNDIRKRTRPAWDTECHMEMKAMQYVYSLPVLTSFDGKGLFGYTFGPLRQGDLELYYIVVEKGHDTFMVSHKITRIYYVLSGSGYFTIDNRRYDVSRSMLVEVPPKVEYSYSGKMELIAVSRPRWFSGNDTHTKWNPDVIQGDFPSATSSRPLLTRLVRLRIFGKSPINAYLRLNRRLWNKLPTFLTALAPIRLYGDFLHKLVRIQGVRTQAFATYFLRNRPQLELIRRLVERGTKTDTLKAAVLGCSIGPEAYSVAWRIRSARPDLKLILHAVDISRKAVEVGRRGVYSLASEPTNTDVFERMTEAETQELFDRDGDIMEVKAWIKQGINWHAGDVGEPEIVEALGPQDIVVANNFLCHMDPAAAEKCLRNIARLVSPGGHLLVSGIDLDVRTKVAGDLGWNPLQESLEEIHDGDPCMKGFWPFHYGGLEPLDKRRRDWRLRYAAAFQLDPSGESAQNRIVVEDGCGGSVNPGASAAALLANESTRVSDAALAPGDRGCV